MRRSLIPFLLLLAAAGPSPSWTNGTFSGTIGVGGVATLSGGGALTGSFAGGTFTGTTLTTPTINGGALSGTFTGVHTYSGATTLSGGGTLSGTFAGTPTWSGLNSFTAGLSATTNGTVTLSLGNSSTNTTLNATGTNAGMNLTIPAGSGAISFGQGGSFVESINGTSVYPKTMVVASANQQGSAGGTITWSGTSLLPPNVASQVWAGWAGTLPNSTSQTGHGGVPMALFLNNTGDNLKIATSGVGYVGNIINQQVVGSAAQGARNALYNFLDFHSTTADAAAGNQTGGTAATNEAFTDASQGGTGATLWNGTTGSNGNFWGTVSIAQMAPASGPQYYGQGVGDESDVSCNTNCRVLQIDGYQAVLLANHANQGLAIDTAYGIGVQSGATAVWRNAYSVGQYAGIFPLNSSSTGFGFLPASDWPGNTMPVGNAFYATEATISVDAFASKLFSVDGAGNASHGTLAIVPNGASTTLDTTYSVGNAQGSTIATIGGGSGWPSSNFNFRLTDTNRGVYYCSTVVAGACTVVTVYRQPRIATASKPGNPVTLTPDGNASQHGVAGTLTANLSWTDGATLNLGTSAATAVNIGNATANVLLGSGSALATNATVGFPLIPSSAGAPTGTVAGAGAGKVAIQIDTTNKKLCYSVGGGTWECSAAFTP